MAVILRLSSLALVTLFTAPLACAATLYNGSLGTSLETQGWTFAAYSYPWNPGSFTETVSGGATILTTTGGEFAGYTPSAALQFNSASGYQVSFTVQLDSESATSGNRSGFCIIAIGSDQTGIELDFWPSSIWAQEVGFTKAETTGWTTSAKTNYTLAVRNGIYTLSAPGMATLTGPLRSYGLAPFYTTPNFLYLGDNTSSANASVRIYSVSYTELPEPATLLLAAPMLLALMLRRKSPHAKTIGAL